MAAAAQTSPSPLKMFIPITKIDVEQRLVYGRVTDETPDRAGEICDYASSKPHFKTWSDDIAKTTGGKSFGNVRVMHGKKVAGPVKAIDFDDEAKAIDVCAKIVDDDEWKMVQEGGYTGFSQGGRYVRRWADPDQPALMRYTAEPMEISLVDLPCLPTATFSVIKAHDTVEQHTFKSVVAEPDAAAVMDRAAELAKAAGDAEPTDAQLDAARAALLQDALVKATPKDGESAEVTPTVEVVETNADEHPDKKLVLTPGNPENGATEIVAENLVPEKSVKPGRILKATQGWFCNNPDHRHEQRAEAEKCIRTAGVSDAVKAATAPLTEGMAELQRTLGIEVPAATAVAAVENTPVVDATVLERAAVTPTVDVPSMLKAIVAMHVSHVEDSPAHADALVALSVALKALRAKGEDAGTLVEKATEASGAALALPGASLVDLGAKAGYVAPPLIDPARVARKTVFDRLGKGLSTCARLANLIEDLSWVAMGVGAEEIWEGDTNSPLPGMMRDSIKSLTTALTAMVAEETRELVAALGPETIEIVVFEMTAPVAGLVKFMRAAEGLQEAAVVLEKAGSGELNTSIAALTVAVEARRTVEKAGRRNNASDQKRVQKVHDLATELGAECAMSGKAAHPAEGEGMEKMNALETENAILKSAIVDHGAQIGVILEEVKKLKASPAPAKAAIFAVSKDAEVSGATGDKPTMSAKEAAALVASLPEEERRQMLMKLSLANPTKLLR